MKQILIICTLAIAVSSIALGQTKDKQADQKQAVPNSQAEQEIMKLENELVEAGLRGDAATADLLMADDYFFMTRDGVVHENLKAALLVRMRSGERGADLLARMKSGPRSSFRPLRPIRQKNVRQKNEEDQTHSLFFCLTFFCLVAETMIKAEI